MNFEANRGPITVVLLILAIVFFIFYAAAAVFDPNVDLGVGLALLSAAALIAG